MNSSRSYAVTTSTIILALIILIGRFQKESDDLGPPFTTKLAIAKRDLLPSTILPYIHFGFTNILTDFYWIRAIQDFIAWNGKESFFLDYFKNISTLDPRFEYPYLFSILAVPQNKDLKTLDKVAAIAGKGIDTIPTSWKIPFYLGTQYYLFTRTYDKPEHYLAIAASRKSAPDGVYILYSSFIGKSVVPPLQSEEDRKTAQSLVEIIYNNTDNETIKELAGKGIQEQAVTKVLEKGIAAYKVKYGKYPKNVNEMLVVNFINLPDELLNNFIIEINQKDGSYRIRRRGG